MDEITVFWIVVVFLAILIALFGWLIVYLIKRVVSLQKPYVKKNITEEKIKKIISFMKDLNLEERMYVIRSMFGNSKILCSINQDGIKILTAGHDPEEIDDSSEGIPYTG